MTAQNALILSLDTDLQSIARTASAIAQDVPGFDDLFAPPPHYNPGELLATANACLVQLISQAASDGVRFLFEIAAANNFVNKKKQLCLAADFPAAILFA